ncbi:MAG: hypothetical protein ACXAB4_09690 [Candidatus Hodarchaeales archaeon]|jgi:hypothetical protein
MSLSDLDTFQQALGISSLSVALSSFLIGVYLIIQKNHPREKEGPDIQQLLTGVAIIGLGGTWLGEAVQFLVIVLIGKPLDLLSHSYLVGWALPLAAIVWIYLAFSLVKTELRNYALGMVGVISGLFLVTLYVLLPFIDTKVLIHNRTETETAEWIAEYAIPPDSKLPEFHFVGILGLIVIIYLLVIGCVGGIFLWESTKNQAARGQWEYRLRGIGCLVFCATAQTELLWRIHLIDIGSPLNDFPLIAIVVRAAIIGSFLLVWLSCTLPNWLQKIVGLAIEEEIEPFDSILDIIAEGEEEN